MYEECESIGLIKYIMQIKYLIKNSEFLYFYKVVILITKVLKNNQNSKINFIKYNVHIEINIYIVGE